MVRGETMKTMKKLQVVKPSWVTELKPDNVARKVFLGMGVFCLGAALAVPFQNYSAGSVGYAGGAFFATMWCAVLLYLFARGCKDE